MRALVAALVLLLFCTACASSSAWIYSVAVQGAGWAGYVLRSPLNDTTVIHMLGFTVGARAMIADDNYVYWGLYNGSWWIARASHDLTDVDLTWLAADGSVCGKGLVYAWAVDKRANVLWYQLQADYQLCRLDLTTMKATSYGYFAYNGGGGMNGQLQLYADPATNVTTALLWGVDMGEVSSSGGTIYYMDVSDGPSTPRPIYSGLEFPRAGLVIPGTNTTLVGGYNTQGALVGVDVFSGDVVLNINPYKDIAAPCNAAADEVTGAVYLSGPGVGGGVFQVNLNNNSYSRIINPSSAVSCMACFCGVAIARPGASPPPPPPPAPTTAPPSAAVPWVEWVVPINGSTAGGYTLYVAGASFQNSTALTCKVGRSLATLVSFVSPVLIGCKVPESPIAGQAVVSVANDGVHFSTESVYFTYLDQ